MSFFRKLWKGVKKVFKKIGKGIKKVFKKVGKFLGKFPIVGMIAMVFAPYLAPVFAGMWAGATAAVGAWGAAGAAVANVMTVAGQFAATVGNVYKTITGGISSFVGKVGGGMVNSVSKALGGSGNLISSAPSSLSEGFGNWMSGVADDAANITSPFSKAATEVSKDVATTQAAGDQIAQVTLDDMEMPKIEAPTVDGQVTDALDLDFNVDAGLADITKIPDVEVLSPSTPVGTNLDSASFGKVAGAEQSAFKKAITGVTKAVKAIPGQVIDKAKDLPGQFIDQTAANLASLPGQYIQEEAGFGPKTPIYNQNTTVVDSFMPAYQEAQNAYEEYGYDAGATPHNRLTYYAGQQQGFSNDGFDTFQAFSRTGVAA